MSRLTQEVDGLKTQMQRSLLSDHFAQETTLPVQSASVVPRKRLTVPPSRMVGLVVHVVAWYTAVKGSFADAEALHDGLLHTIEGFICFGKGPCSTPQDLCCRPCDSELPTDTRCLPETLAAQPSRHRVTGCHGYRGSTPHGSVAAGKEEVLGLLPGPGAWDLVPPGRVAPCQKHPGQVQATGV
ncbi:uncharacterized protein LOC123501366 [Portunus trituberculatus]|uniref:uncharacterized protein LOC123501366 n=1 Tax=Portunus trituberculatus TaxID=210409 RepID=UPI001E1CDDD0|nr:uncharacterized protein LOC123501366 [Portunus trituberculatus]